MARRRALSGSVPGQGGGTRCEQLLEDEGARDPALQVQILGALAFLTAMQGQHDQARDHIVRGRRIAEELGHLSWLFSFHVAQVLLWGGAPAAAEAELRPPYEALKKLGEKSHFSTMVHYLAVAVYTQGRYDEAEQLARECEEATRANDVHSQILWRSTRAKVLARRGEFEEALSLAHEAIAIAADSDFLLANAEALMDMAEVLELAGQPDPAAAAIGEAAALFEQKGNVVAAARPVRGSRPSRQCVAANPTRLALEADPDEGRSTQVHGLRAYARAHARGCAGERACKGSPCPSANEPRSISPLKAESWLPRAWLASFRTESHCFNSRV